MPNCGKRTLSIGRYDKLYMLWSQSYKLCHWIQDNTDFAYLLLYLYYIYLYYTYIRYFYIYFLWNDNIKNVASKFSSSGSEFFPSLRLPLNFILALDNKITDLLRCLILFEQHLFPGVEGSELYSPNYLSN